MTAAGGSLTPLHGNNLGFARLPGPHAAGANMDNFTQALCLGAESRMSKKTTDVKGNFDIFHIQPDQAVCRMAKLAAEKILVLREQRRALEPMEQRDQIIVMNPSAGDFLSDLPKGYAPLP